MNDSVGDGLRYREALNRVTYKDWQLAVECLGDRHYLQVQFDAPEGRQHGRKWLLSPHMTNSEIVQTALKAVLTAEEHEARERFTYCGQRVFGPHLNVEALAAAIASGAVAPEIRLTPVRLVPIEEE